MRAAAESSAHAALMASSAATNPSARPRCRSLASLRARPKPTQATPVDAYQVTIRSVATAGLTAQASSWLTQRKPQIQSAGLVAFAPDSRVVSTHAAATARAAALSLVRKGAYS